MSFYDVSQRSFASRNFALLKQLHPMRANIGLGKNTSQPLLLFRRSIASSMPQQKLWHRNGIGFIVTLRFHCRCLHHVTHSGKGESNARLGDKTQCHAKGITFKRDSTFKSCFCNVILFCGVNLKTTLVMNTRQNFFYFFFHNSVLLQRFFCLAAPRSAVRFAFIGGDDMAWILI